MTSRKAKPLRAQCDQHLPWLLGDMLLDRVPLDLLPHVTRANTDRIVEEFVATHDDVIEMAIVEVDGLGLGYTSFTEVVDRVFPSLLIFAKKRGDFLDRPLSPYAGLPRSPK